MKKKIYYIIIGIEVVVLLALIITTLVYNKSIVNKEEKSKSKHVIEVGAFNSMFMVYEGEQLGAKLKALIGTLIANANTYAENPNSIPGVSINRVSELDSDEDSIDIAGQPKNENEIQEYISSLARIRKNLTNKHIYKVRFEYFENDIEDAICKIIIEY